MKIKNVSEVPTDLLSRGINEYTDHFLVQFGQRQYTKLVITGNRVYCNYYISKAAIESQRYTWKANYTLNLLHSVHGVDYFDILGGP